MLRYRDPRSRNDYRGSGRNIEGIRHVTARTAGIYNTLGGLDPRGLFTHDARCAGNLFDGFAFDAQGGQKCSDLCVGRPAFHYLVNAFGRLGL